jgi:hypothetical protein
VIFYTFFVLFPLEVIWLISRSMLFFFSSVFGSVVEASADSFLSTYCVEAYCSVHSGEKEHTSLGLGFCGENLLISPVKMFVFRL